MGLPTWDDPDLKAGTMVRGALWLIREVGEGNVFTKEQMRKVFPRIAQADRRLRDLRKYGWVIHTSADDASLRNEEQRLVKVGLAVWDSGERRKAAQSVVSAKARQATLAADHYQCVICGIAGGEIYPDAPTVTAVLSVSRREVGLPDGKTESQLVTECKHCRAGANGDEIGDVTRLLTDIRNLDDADRVRLQRWMHRGQRGATPLDRVWTAYRKLPTKSRADILKLLGS
jgi:hypothetical protein